MADDLLKYTLHWRSRLTGLDGLGSPILGAAAARAWIEEANKRWPELQHWAEISLPSAEAK